MSNGNARSRAEKKGLKNAPINDSEATIVWSSHDSTFRGLGAKSEAPDPEIVQAINEAANHLNSNQQVHQHNIWRQAQASTYNRNFPQETLTNLHEARRNPHFMAMDTEILGTFSPGKGDALKFYSPTEIAIGHMYATPKGDARFVNGKIFGGKYGKENVLSMVLKPGQNYSALDELVKKLERSPRVNVPLSQDERRTLQDLILYSDASKFGTKKINGIKIATITGQARDQQLMGAASLIQRETVRKIRSGLENLQKYGTHTRNAALVLNEFMHDVTSRVGDNTSLVGHNIKAFDRPMILDWLERNLGKGKGYSKPREVIQRLKDTTYVDTMQVERTLRRNPGGLNRNLKLSTLAAQKGLLARKGTYIGRMQDGAHFGAYDIEMNGRLFASQMVDYHTIRSGHLPLNEVMRDIRYSKFDQNPLALGDRMFALSGVFSGKEHIYDGVFNKGSDGKFSPAYIMNNAATLYTNATYKIHGMGTMNQGGKTYHTATLLNEDRGTYHFFARENIEDLQNVFHKNLAFIHGDGNSRDRTLLAIQSRNDAALRRWNKMFSDEAGGGINLINRMSKAYDAYHSTEAQAMSEDERKAHVMKKAGYSFNNQDVDASESFYRDFMTMRERFGQELPYINEMVTAMKGRSELMNDPHAQNIALRHFRNAMDERFGENKKKVHASSAYRTAMGIEVDGETKMLNISANVDATSRSLYNVVTSGHISKNMTPALIRSRLKSVLHQLHAEAPDVMTRNQRKHIEDMINAVNSENGSYYVTQEISLRLSQAHEDASRRRSLFGFKTVDIESPTKLVSNRAANLAKDWSAHGTEIITKSMDRAAAYHSRAYDGMVIPSGGVLENILQHQDDVVNRIVNKAGISNSRVIGAKSAREALNNMLKSYISTDMRATLYHDEGKRGLMLALYHKDHESTVVGSKVSDLVKNNHVALVNLPTINANGELQVGSTRRVARLVALKGPNQSIQIGTGFDEVMQKLTALSGTVEKMFQGGRGALDVEGFMSSLIRRTTENLSMNNTKNLMADGNAFEVRKSKASNWARRHMIDVNAFAEEWFQDYHQGNNVSTHVRKIKEIMHDPKNRGMDFFEAMSNYRMYDGKTRINNKMKFQENIEEWLGNKYGLHVNSHSVKDTLVSQNVRSFANISELNPFGFYNQMARENMMKSVNYMPLDEKMVRDGLKAQGFSDTDIERMVRRGVTTETAHEVMAGETNFLSLRTAHMNSAEVLDAFTKGGMSMQDAAKLSTHEGMFVMRSDVAAGFTVRRSKEIELSDGAKLTNQIEKALQQGMANHGIDGNFDYGKTVIFDQGVKLNTRKRDRFNRFTVGKLAQGKSVDYYTDVQNNVFVKGWDADRQRLILEKEEKLEDGHKMLTSEGHRITVSVREKEWFDKAGLGDIEAILPMPELNKRMYGTYMDSAAQLAYDAMYRNKVTAGKVALDEGLATLQDLMNTHLGTKGKIRIANSQLVLDSMLGIDTPDAYSFKNINNFLEDAGKAFGADLTGHKHLLGQTGFAVADITNWEDTAGFVNGEVGKVRWGLKEVDVIQARLDRLSAKGMETGAVSKWLTGHMDELVRTQSPDAERMANALTRTVMNSSTRDAVQRGEVRPGDVIIRTSATNSEMTIPGLTNDGGKRYGIVDKNNVVHVHANAFDGLPMKSARGVTTTVGDLQNTLITMGENELPIYKDGKQIGTRLNDVLAANHGTALLELPSGLSHKYVRMVHQDVSSIGGGMAVMKELQQHQSKIWRLVNEYNTAAPGSDPSHSLGQLQEALDDYHGKAAHMFSSAREQSLAKTLMTAKQDMSGRFKIQGINPTEAATKGYEEATAYVSRKKMSEMIASRDGSTERRIAQTLFSADEFASFDGMHQGKLHKKVLDKIEETGLYGFVGRYPTIAEDTIQVMKMAIDPTMGRTYQGAMLTVGTAVKLKADYDGDFLSSVLSHYGLDNSAERDAIHKQLGDVWKADKQSLEDHYYGTNGEQGYYHTEIAPKMQEFEAEASRRGITVGKLMRDPDFRGLDGLAASWKKQTSGLYDLESLQARLGKQLIGSVDNTRQNLLNLSSTTYDILQRAGKMTQQQAMDSRKLIETFGRDLSQNYISSKKFNIEDIRRELLDKGGQGTEKEVQAVVARRRDSLGTFLQGLITPDKQGVEMMTDANKELEIFKDKSSFEAQVKEVQNMFKLQGESQDWLHNRNFMGVSEGRDADLVNQFLRGEGRSTIVATPWVKDFMANMDLSNPDIADAHARMTRSIKLHEKTVLSAFENISGTNKFMGLDASTHLSDEMLGTTVSQQAGAKLSQTLGDVFGKGRGSGFGALKIGGGVFAAVWAANTLTAKAPTPESMQSVIDGGNPQLAPAPPSVMGGPTARIAMNGESTHVHVSAKGNMDSQRIAAMIHSEMTNMVPMQLNMNMNVNDNSQNIDKQWLQQTMANAISFGRAF